jgi:hypothetical protein
MSPLWHSLESGKDISSGKHGFLLDHVVSQKGKEPDLKKIEVIVNFQPPSDVKGM